MSFSYIRETNEFHDSMLLWGRPSFTLTVVDVVFNTLTWIFLFLRKFSRNFRRLPWKPNSCNFPRIRYLQPVSYTFDKSKNRAMECWWLFIAFLTSHSNWTRLSVVLRFSLKPDWASQIWLFVSSNHISRNFTILSISLQRQLVKEIGR